MSIFDMTRVYVWWSRPFFWLLFVAMWIVPLPLVIARHAVCAVRGHRWSHGPWSFVDLNGETIRARLPGEFCDVCHGYRPEASR